jgi:hypothetical protein
LYCIVTLGEKSKVKSEEMESVQSEKKKEIPEKLEDDENGNLMSSTVKETQYSKNWLMDQ